MTAMASALAALLRKRPNAELAKMARALSDDELAALGARVLTGEAPAQRPTRTRAPAQKSAPRASRERPAVSAKRTPADATSKLERVFQAVVGADDAVRFSDLVDATGLDGATVKRYLDQLVATKRVFRAQFGGRKSPRYAITQEAADEASKAACKG